MLDLLSHFRKNPFSASGSERQYILKPNFNSSLHRPYLNYWWRVALRT